MGWVISNARAGLSPITGIDTAAQAALGTKIDGYHETLGGGEFIYLLGAANTVVGSVVIYNATTFQTVLALGSTHKNSGAPVAVAMAATLAGQFGWYQIGGNATVKKTAVAVAPQVPVMLSATGGRVKVLTSAGFMIVGARSANLTTTTSTTSTVIVTINRPHIQGQIT
jgi:hypothetical protein